MQPTKHAPFKEAMTLLNLGYRPDPSILGKLTQPASGGQLHATTIEVWRVMLDIAESPPDSRTAPL